ncbi:MAG: aspartate kinase [Anaerolineales bacterium]|nr:aspartate kinase [Anaerolineales bacterium]
MLDTVVMKFGGTSVGGAAAIRQLIEIVRAGRTRWPGVAVVVSAMSGVTDILLHTAHAAERGEAHLAPAAAEKLREKHLAALRELAPAAPGVADHITACLDEFAALCHAIGVLGEASPRALDAIAALGERMSAPLVAAALERAGVPARPVDAAEVVLTDSVYQAASPDMEATRARAASVVQPLLAAGVVPVITGFIGATRAGVVTTLGRGGSDFSGAIFGVALEAREVWIWTDVTGVMTADPRVVKAARTLPEMTFREISELAYYGAKVLHPKTIRPVVERGIALWVKNTFQPELPGTRIVADSGPVQGSVRAVTAFRGQCILTLEGRGMMGIPGIAARTFAAVARTRTSISLISQASSEQSICFVVPRAASETVQQALEEEFRLEFARGDIDTITASPECAVVTVVGAGMRHTPGIAGRVFSALGAAGVNVVVIAQGSSECSISLVVEAGQADEAVRAIHQMIETVGG